MNSVLVLTAMIYKQTKLSHEHPLSTAFRFLEAADSCARRLLPATPSYAFLKTSFHLDFLVRTFHLDMTVSYPAHYMRYSGADGVVF